LNFKKVLKFIIEEFTKEQIEFALIGGFALDSANVSRATVDVDLLVLAEKKNPIKQIMTAKGYMLDPEMKREMLEDAADPKRREDFRQGRLKSVKQVSSLDDYLNFLEGVQEAFPHAEISRKPTLTHANRL